MNKIHLLAIGLLVAVSIILSSPTDTVACTTSTDQQALDICYSRCKDLYSGDSFISNGLKSACFAGCQVGCWLHENT